MRFSAASYSASKESTSATGGHDGNGTNVCVADGTDVASIRAAEIDVAGVGLSAGEVLDLASVAVPETEGRADGGANTIRDEVCGTEDIVDEILKDIGAVK